MKIVLTALAIAIASPTLAQQADPHASHQAPASAPAAPTHADHDADKKACCKGMEGKGCCAEKAKSNAEAHAGHHGH